MCLCCVSPWSPARALRGLQRRGLLSLLELETKRTKEHEKKNILGYRWLSFLCRMVSLEIICPRFLKWSTCSTERNPSRLPRCSHVRETHLNCKNNMGNKETTKTTKTTKDTDGTEQHKTSFSAILSARKQGTTGRDVWLVDVWLGWRGHVPVHSTSLT